MLLEDQKPARVNLNKVPNKKSRIHFLALEEVLVILRLQVDSCGPLDVSALIQILLGDRVNGIYPPLTLAEIHIAEKNSVPKECGDYISWWWTCTDAGRGLDGSDLPCYILRPTRTAEQSFWCIDAWKVIGFGMTNILTGSVGSRTLL